MNTVYTLYNVSLVSFLLFSPSSQKPGNASGCQAWGWVLGTCGPRRPLGSEDDDAGGTPFCFLSRLWKEIRHLCVCVHVYACVRAAVFVCVCICVWVCLQVHNSKVSSLTGGLTGWSRLVLGVGWLWYCKGERVRSPVSCLLPFPCCREMEVYGNS